MANKLSMAISEIAIHVGIYSFLVGVAVLFCGLLVLHRYLERKQKATLYLMFSLFSWVGSAWSASFIYITARDNVTLATYVQVFMYACVFSATIFTYMFARKVIFKAKTTFYIYYTIAGIIAILILAFAPSSEAVNFPDSTDHPAIVLKFEYSLILMVYLIPTIFKITYEAFKVSKRMEEMVYKVGFRMIGTGQLIILVLFVFDTIAGFNFDNPEVYALSLYMQWTCGLLASVFYYLGWILPNWFKKLFKIEV